MMRARSSLVASLLLAALLASGCANSRTGTRGRGLAAGILVGVAAVAIGSAAYSTMKVEDKEDQLRADANAGSLTGREFTERDNEAKRWNRAARASVFVSGLALVGLAIVGEMALADRRQFGPLPPPTEKPIIPGQAPENPRVAALPLAPVRPATDLARK